MSSARPAMLVSVRSILILIELKSNFAIASRLSSHPEPNANPSPPPFLLPQPT